MLSAFDSFVIYTLLNIIVGLYGLVELPKFDVDDLITTEKIIRNCTNSLLSDLKLAKPVNSTRIKDFATLHHYFLSVTFRDSDVLKEIARLTRVDYKINNNTVGNLTTVINALLDENSCEYDAKDVLVDDADAIVTTYIDDFLAKLESLKESYGVNKVFSDINSNIIKIFRYTNALESKGVVDANLTNDENSDSFTVLESSELWESGRRIYRGERTKIKYFPFMASIQIFNAFQCAGSIIKSDLVITASSCLQLAWNNRFYRENPAFLSVRVGSSFYNSGGEVIPVLEIYFHPGYNPKTLRDNICVLRLLRHIKFRHRDRKKVRKIAIDNKPWSLAINTPGITIVGWGAKGISNKLGSPWANILSYANLDVYPLRECQEVYSKTYVTTKHFCGGFFSKGSGACNRDVGAPGVVNGILMGVVSFGSPVCGTPDVPTVFTKLGYYHNWIENIMEMDVPRSKKRTTLQVEEDPYAPYMTTPYTTTTFKIEPVQEGVQPMPALEEDEESALRMLLNDNKLFQEFLETMFDSDATQKINIKQDTEISRQNKINSFEGEPTNEITKGSTIVSDKNDSNNEAYKRITAGFGSDVYATGTVDVSRDSDESSEDDIPVTKYTSEHQELNHETKLISATENTLNIGRNFENFDHTQIENKNHFSATTTDSPQEILLELATESSDDDSDDSNQSQSDDNDKNFQIKKDLNAPSSVDFKDISGEQAIAELLDEIDLNQILREVSMDMEMASNSPLQNYAEAPQSNVLTTATMPVAQKEGKMWDKLRNNKNSESHDQDSEDSVLTLLYLSDNEKKNNFASKSGNDIRVDRRKNITNTATIAQNSVSSDTVYDILPKTKLYKIISEVLKAAVEKKQP
ncbi:unnamed protein product, partial [Iphiclides podalirius]